MPVLYNSSENAYSDSEVSYNGRRSLSRVKNATTNLSASIDISIRWNSQFGAEMLVSSNQYRIARGLAVVALGISASTVKSVKNRLSSAVSLTANISRLSLLTRAVSLSLSGVRGWFQNKVQTAYISLSSDNKKFITMVARQLSIVLSAMVTKAKPVFLSATLLLSSSFSRTFFSRLTLNADIVLFSARLRLSNKILRAAITLSSSGSGLFAGLAEVLMTLSSAITKSIYKRRTSTIPLVANADKYVDKNAFEATVQLSVDGSEEAIKEETRTTSLTLSGLSRRQIFIILNAVLTLTATHKEVADKEQDLFTTIILTDLIRKKINKDCLIRQHS
jgi:hypothetical protein